MHPVHTAMPSIQSFPYPYVFGYSAAKIQLFSQFSTRKRQNSLKIPRFSTLDNTLGVSPIDNPPLRQMAEDEVSAIRLRFPPTPKEWLGHYLIPTLTPKNSSTLTTLVLTPRKEYTAFVLALILLSLVTKTSHTCAK